ARSNDFRVRPTTHQQIPHRERRVFEHEGCLIETENEHKFLQSWTERVEFKEAFQQLCWRECGASQDEPADYPNCTIQSAALYSCDSFDAAARSHIARAASYGNRFQTEHSNGRCIDAAFGRWPRRDVS